MRARGLLAGLALVLVTACGAGESPGAAPKAQPVQAQPSSGQSSGQSSGPASGSQASGAPSASVASPGVPAPPPELPGPQPIPAVARVIPVRVEVPAIGVDASDLEPLGRGSDGEMVPPVDFDKAGYYVDGPAAGDPGPAVIAAHVDDRSGPKVFFRLRELTPGDEVRVTRSDGRLVVFRVDAVEQYPKGAFPTAAVYGPQPGSSLRLITCGGSFDRSVRSYRDNIVVYASEVG